MTSHHLASLPLLVALFGPSCGGNVVVDENAATGNGSSSTGATTGTSGGTGGGSVAGGTLVGIWSGSAGGPTRLLQTLVIHADGTVTASDAFETLGGGGTTSCSGELLVADRWTATATTFSVSGGTCSGSVSCPNGPSVTCGTAETSPQTCTYALRDGNDTLTLDCPLGNGSIQLTRQM